METSVERDICPLHPTVDHAVFLLHCSALVTRVVAIGDDYRVQIDNVQEYDRVHDNCLDEKLRRLSL